MTDVSVGIRPPCRFPVRWTSNQDVLGFFLSSHLCLKKHLCHVFTRLKIHYFMFIIAPYTALVLWALSSSGDGLCIFSSLHFSDSWLNLLDDFDFDFDDLAVKTSNSLLYCNLYLHLVRRGVLCVHGNLEDWIFCPPCCFQNYKNHQWPEKKKNK